VHARRLPDARLDPGARGPEPAAVRPLSLAARRLPRLRRDFDARYLLVDKTFLWDIRYEAGLPSRAPTPPPAGAAFRLLHNDPEVYGSVPGYRLLYRSLNPISRYRIYELIDAE
jgi:hypothetical protein